MNKPIVFIVFGKPGSGKETAQKMLTKHIETICGVAAFISDSGSLFRDALNERPDAPSFNAFHKNRMESIQSSGKLQTSALATLMWMNHFIQHYNDQRFIIVDGSPRREAEIINFIQHFQEFYDATIEVVHVDVTDEVALERMKARHDANPRPETSTPELRANRLQDFHEKNSAALDALTNFWKKKLHTVDNNGSLESLEKQIKRIKLVD